MVYGLWLMVYGLWSMVYGLWFIVSILGFRLYGIGLSVQGNSRMRVEGFGFRDDLIDGPDRDTNVVWTHLDGTLVQNCCEWVVKLSIVRCGS